MGEIQVESYLIPRRVNATQLSLQAQIEGLFSYANPVTFEDIQCSEIHVGPFAGLTDFNTEEFVVETPFVDNIT